MMTDALEVMRRYPDIKTWDVLNEPLRYYEVDEGIIFDAVQDLQGMAELFRQAHEINPEAKLYVNECGIPHSSGNKSEEFKQYIQRLLEHGAPVSALGIQAHMGDHDELPTIAEVKSQLNSLSELGLPIAITEFDCTDKAAGSEADRARYMQDLLTLFYGLPYISGVYLWGFQDKEHWRGSEGAGLFDENMQPNQVGRAYFDRIQKDWHTNATVKTDASGQAVFRGFPGKYSVTPEATNNTQCPLELEPQQL